MKKIITRQQVDIIIKNFRGSIKIGPYVIHDNSLTVYGDVRLCHSNSYKLPLKFKYVYGDFIISSNKLTTLKGCPTYVAGDFNCYGNDLTSLKYAPNEVGGNFSCHENTLTSLVGSPSSISLNFSCFLNNKLTTLVGGPTNVKGNYYANNCNLKSLSGSPLKVGQSFFITANYYLKNLTGLPEYIGNILAFDNTTSINLGNQNCNVKIIEIQTQERTCHSEFFLHQVVVDNKKHLPVVFKYFRHLELFSENEGFTGNEEFNELNFSDIILEIKEGLL